MVDNKVFSLVKYNNPVLVTVKGANEEEQADLQLETSAEDKLREAPSEVKEPETGIVGLLGTAPRPKICLPPLQELRKKETEELLGLILPPRKWEENGQLWVQSVSTTPATYVDVQQLQEHLDLRLQEQKAFETGICPTRRELYTQCFDELIRQVTVNCAERGLLLFRVRDEIRETLDAYQRLYISSCAYGVRKALMAEEHKVNVGARCTELRQEVKELEDQTAQLRQDIDELQNQAEEAMKIEAEKHEETKEQHQAKIEILKKKLESIIKQAIQPKK